MGCGCGKSFSSYATGTRHVTTHHAPTTRPVSSPPPISYQSKTLQSRRSVQTSVQSVQNSSRRKV